jgi:hypothetical protein
MKQAEEARAAMPSKNVSKRLLIFLTVDLYLILALVLLLIVMGRGW